MKKISSLVLLIASIFILASCSGEDVADFDFEGYKGQDVSSNILNDGDTMSAGSYVTLTAIAKGRSNNNILAQDMGYILNYGACTKNDKRGLPSKSEKLTIQCNKGDDKGNNVFYRGTINVWKYTQKTPLNKNKYWYVKGKDLGEPSISVKYDQTINIVNSKSEIVNAINNMTADEQLQYKENTSQSAIDYLGSQYDISSSEITDKTIPQDGMSDPSLNNRQ